jgi:hypothetical protein
VKKSKLLPDAVYVEEAKRLSGLRKFPAVPSALQELYRAMRRIAEADSDFLHRLISDVVDTATVCPTPAELIQMAGAKRHRQRTSAGRADCSYCEGTGFVITFHMVHPQGFEPYEASFAAVCACRGGK